MVRIHHHIRLKRDDILNLADATVALLPLGALENHGDHLPVGTDSILADAIVARALAELSEPLANLSVPDVAGTQGAEAAADGDATLLVLPTLWLGVSTEHTGQPGTVSAPPQLMAQSLAAITASLARNGIRRLVLFSAHGGNNASARIAALEARAAHQMLVVPVHWTEFGMPDDLTRPTTAAEDKSVAPRDATPADFRRDAHAGWVETSMMLAVDPDLVAHTPPSDTAARPVGIATSPLGPRFFPDGPLNWGWMSQDLNTTGVIGCPEGATADRGERLLAHAAEGLAEVILTLAAARWPAAGTTQGTTPGPTRGPRDAGSSA